MGLEKTGLGKYLRNCNSLRAENNERCDVSPTLLRDTYTET